MERLTMRIEGMSCGHCVRAVDGALKAIDGVGVEQVQIGQATVSYDPRTTSPEQITGAVAAEGYAVVDRSA